MGCQPLDVALKKASAVSNKLLHGALVTFTSPESHLVSSVSAFIKESSGPASALVLIAHDTHLIGYSRDLSLEEPFYLFFY